MRDVDVGRAGGDARERADVDSAGSVARDEYGDGERDDEERGTTTKNGTRVRIRRREPPPPQRGCKCPPVAEDERSNRGERVGVEQDGRGRNGLGKERGGWMGTICS